MNLFSRPLPTVTFWLGVLCVVLLLHSEASTSYHVPPTHHVLFLHSEASTSYHVPPTHYPWPGTPVQGPSDRPLPAQGPYDRPLPAQGPYDRPLPAQGPYDRPLPDKEPSVSVFFDGFEGYNVARPEFCEPCHFMNRQGRCIFFQAECSARSGRNPQGNHNFHP